MSRKCTTFFDDDAIVERRESSLMGIWPKAMSEPFGS